MTFRQILTTTTLIAAMAVSGMAYADDHGKGSWGGWGGPSSSLQEILAKLPAEKSKQFNDTLQANREKNKPLYAQMKKLHEASTNLLLADKFDKAAYLANSAEMEKLQTQVHANMNEAYANALSQLSKEDRKMIADQKQERMKRFEDRMKDKKQGDDKKPDAK